MQVMNPEDPQCLRGDDLEQDRSLSSSLPDTTQRQLAVMDGSNGVRQRGLLCC